MAAPLEVFQPPSPHPYVPRRLASSSCRTHQTRRRLIVLVKIAKLNRQLLYPIVSGLGSCFLSEQVFAIGRPTAGTLILSANRQCE
jgi:hypothetical protein